MDWILYALLALAVAGDVLLAVVLVMVLRKNNEPKQKIDTADDFVRAITPVMQGETDLLAEQLRAMQGESARTTSATLRDFSAVLAENQRQSAANSTARLDAIDRAGAARQKAANDALLAQLTMMETRLKNLEDSNATRMDSVRGALVQGLNTIRADNNRKLDEIRGTVGEITGHFAAAHQRLVQGSQHPAGTGLQGAGRNAESCRRRGQPEAGAVRR